MCYLLCGQCRDKYAEDAEDDVDGSNHDRDTTDIGELLVSLVIKMVLYEQPAKRHHNRELDKEETSVHSSTS